MPKNNGRHKHLAKKHPGWKKQIVFLCSCCATLVLLTLSVFNLELSKNNKVLGITVETTNKDVAGEISFWQDFVNRNPSYFDGWVELTTLRLESGDKAGSLFAYQKAVEINPNSPKLRELKILLSE
ncbi:hypothetical protein A2V61_03950 [Candidatus Woesebacteria bacterium RBG_19FT_COMBO_47_8]|uniref:Uncharacterized protein n=1 Tax=Candidatus Woesebacteria bacterium RBG_13_46_13 TaxID=1802479 RepID=A0A1F7X537_9BACT|nr:MAG: hypothetical protein A2Y68_01955 [Candidatus Woesebacteria bacterium RBG_13_46_13]OGM16816.1 MAG: hypothetical protein A2V61_03950 [Candidatus Woesebacteria bacterium RBG_19FT_COMBO_47_8]HJX59348.1 hypothetical protein [Patescibacteria group bacterium]